MCNVPKMTIHRRLANTSCSKEVNFQKYIHCYFVWFARDFRKKKYKLISTTGVDFMKYVVD